MARGEALSRATRKLVESNDAVALLRAPRRGYSGSAHGPTKQEHKSSHATLVDLLLPPGPGVGSATELRFSNLDFEDIRKGPSSELPSQN